MFGLASTEIVKIFCIMILIGVVVIKIAERRFRDRERTRFSNMSSSLMALEIGQLNMRMSECKTSHVLHFLLCIPTVGFWALPWFLLAASNNSKRNSFKVLSKIAMEQANQKDLTKEKSHG